MNKSDRPSMYRKRYIPDEIKSLEKDEILYMSDDVIVTKWDTFRPKKNFSNGISCTFVNKGFKISKFMDNNGKLVYYYCDIIHSDYYKDENKWIFTDLLADVLDARVGKGRDAEALGERLGQICCRVHDRAVGLDEGRAVMRRCDLGHGVHPAALAAGEQRSRRRSCGRRG